MNAIACHQEVKLVQRHGMTLLRMRLDPTQSDFLSMVNERHQLATPMYIHLAVFLEPIHSDNHIIAAQREHLEIGDEFVSLERPLALFDCLVTDQLPSICNFDFQSAYGASNSLQSTC